MMSPDRFDRFRAGPDPLANVFGLLTRMPEALALKTDALSPTRSTGPAPR